MLNDLALQAGEKRLSSVTGFVHFGDTIPVFENFCYALALMRRRTTASFQAGEALVQRLLPFYTGTNFPRFLHTYPKPSTLSFDLPLTVMHRDFARLLKTDLTPYFTEVALPVFDDPYDTDLMCPGTPDLPQEGPEPSLTLQDLYMAGSLQRPTPRILRDHPLHLHAAYLDCGEVKEQTCPPESSGLFYRCQWKGKDYIHTLAANAPLVNGYFTRDTQDLEIYTDLASSITINGHKSTTFHAGDLIEIHTPLRTIRFTLTPSEGRFFGELSRKNRPLQEREGYFDSCLTFRKLSSEEGVRIKFEMNF